MDIYVHSMAANSFQACFGFVLACCIPLCFVIKLGMYPDAALPTQTVNTTSVQYMLQYTVVDERVSVLLVLVCWSLIQYTGSCYSHTV